MTLRAVSQSETLGILALAARMDHFRILFLTANPLETTRLALEQEIREVAAVLERGANRDHFQLIPATAVRAIDLQHLLDRHDPTVVHFAGHGSDVTGEIILHDDHDDACPVDGDALADLMSSRGGVVLNACCSSELSAKIAARGPWSIGMAGRIKTSDAIAFSRSFYGKLADGGSPNDAFTAAFNGLKLTRRKDAADLLRYHPPKPIANATEQRFNATHWLRISLAERAQRIADPFRIGTHVRGLNDIFVARHVQNRSHGDPFPATELLSPDVDRVVVLGEPGSGKSFLLASFGIQLSAERSSFPLLFRAPDLVGRSVGEVVDLVYGEDSSSLVDEYSRDICPTYLVDGLDEVGDETLALDAVRKLEAIPGRHRIILTSRLIGYVNPGPTYREYQLHPLDEDQQLTLLGKWLPDHNVEDLRAIQARLVGDRRMRGLLPNPLLLTLIALYVRDRNELPQGRSKLYRDVVEILLSRKHAAHPTEAPVNDRRAARELLALLAFETHRTDKALTRSRLPAILKNSAGLLKQLRGFENAVDGLVRSGLLMPDLSARFGEEKYYFPHRTIQEYLAAEEVMRNGFLREVADEPIGPDLSANSRTGPRPRRDTISRFDLLVECERNPGKWIEVLALSCGLSPDGDRWLETIAQKLPLGIAMRVAVHAEGVKPSTMVSILQSQATSDQIELLQTLPALLPRLADLLGCVERLLETRPGPEFLVEARTLLRNLVAEKDIFRHIDEMSGDTDELRARASAFLRNYARHERLQVYKLLREINKGKDAAVITAGQFRSLFPHHSPSTAAGLRARVPWRHAQIFAEWIGGDLPSFDEAGRDEWTSVVDSSGQMAMVKDLRGRAAWSPTQDHYSFRVLFAAPGRRA